MATEDEKERLGIVNDCLDLAETRGTNPKLFLESKKTAELKGQCEEKKERLDELVKRLDELEKRLDEIDKRKKEEIEKMRDQIEKRHKEVVEYGIFPGYPG